MSIYNFIETKEAKMQLYHASTQLGSLGNQPIEQVCCKTFVGSSGSDRQRFVELLRIAGDDGNSERITAIVELAKGVADPDRSRQGIMEPYRNAVAGMWGILIFWSAIFKLPFSFSELASLVPCYPGRLTRPAHDKTFVDPMHPSIVWGIVAQLEIPLSQLPLPPTDRQRATVGLCHAVPKFHRLFSGRPNSSARLQPIFFQQGLVLDALVMHKDLSCVINLLSNDGEDVLSVIQDRNAYTVLRQCVAEANFVVAEYPLLAEHCGLISLDEMADALPKLVIYLESWFYCRELLADCLTGDTRLLGLFV